MRIYFQKIFIKQYKKLATIQQKKFKERKKIFLHDEFSPLLNNHALKGAYTLVQRSINITGDLRALYKKDGEEVTFVIVDSHSNLYG